MTGMKQGCILSPLLCAVVIDLATKNELTDVDVRLE